MATSHYEDGCALGWCTCALRRAAHRVCNILVPQHLHCRTPTRFQAAAKALDGLLEEFLMHIGVQRRHGTLHDSVRQTLHSLAARVIVVAVENLLAARVKDAECGIHEITFVVMLALAKARGGILKALALGGRRQQMPHVWPATLKRLNHASQVAGTRLVTKAVPYGGAQRWKLCLQGAPHQVFRVLVSQDLQGLGAALLGHTKQLLGGATWF